MPMALENLAIAHHRDTLRYARIRNGAYWPQLWRFRVGGYMYLQCEAPTTLDVKARRTILRVKDILPGGVLFLEGKDGTRVQGQLRRTVLLVTYLSRGLFV